MKRQDARTPAGVVVILVLLCARVAHANPVILSDDDLGRARIGALIILVGEAVLATGLLARAGLRFWRALPAVILLNFMTYVPLSRWLVHYGHYEITLPASFLWAEALIVALEAGGFWLIAWPAWTRKAGREALEVGKAILLSLLVNFVSVAVSIGLHIYIEETYTP